MSVRRQIAVIDDRLSVEVVGSWPLRYAGGADAATDRPAHVRAGSGLVRLDDGRLVVIQDDSAFIAVIDPRQPDRSLALPLPARGGARQFGGERNNKADKYDFESCVLIDGVVWAFGSGSTSAREAVARWRVDDVSATVEPIAALFAAFRAEAQFSGAQLNIEGCVRVADELWFFQRGNGAGRADRPALDAVCRVSIDAVRAAVSGVQPALGEVTVYDLGTVDGCRLTFTDATELRGGFLFSAAAEASPNTYDDGEVVGTAIGVDDGAAVRYAPVMMDGGRFTAKIEGIAVAAPGVLWAVTDEDDPARPSRLLQLRLSGLWSTVTW